MTDQDQFFPYRLDRRWTPTFVTLGVRKTDGVTVTADARLCAKFGRWSVETPLANIAYTEVTGPHRWYTAVGLRLSRADDGITFGTNHRSGLCIAFIDRVPRVIGPSDHTSLWVSVADPEGLAAVIAR